MCNLYQRDSGKINILPVTCFQLLKPKHVFPSTMIQVKVNWQFDRTIKQTHPSLFGSFPYAVLMTKQHVCQTQQKWERRHVKRSRTHISELPHNSCFQLAWLVLALFGNFISLSSDKVLLSIQPKVPSNSGLRSSCPQLPEFWDWLQVCATKSNFKFVLITESWRGPHKAGALHNTALLMPAV